MRASWVPALLGALALATTNPALAALPDDPPATDEPAADEPAVGEDAPGIQEDLVEGKKELEELLKVEAQEIEGAAHVPPGLDLLGPANPLRQRALDAWTRPGELPGALAPLPEGDAGALLAELGGMDLATLKAKYDIPIELNDEVLAYVRFFQGSGRGWFEKWLARSHRWLPIMRPILAEEGMPLDLVYLAMIESGFSAYAYSWAKASGHWQFISETGRRYGLRDDFWVDERRDPVLATRAAARYLKKLHKEFGHWYLAWAGYNAGEGKMRRAIRMYGTRDFWALTEAGRYLRPETKHYVPKLIAAAIVAKHPERFGFSRVVPEGPFEYDEVVVPDATDLAIVAKAAGVSMEAVQAINPALRRWCTPPARGGEGYTIKLPRGTRDTFLAGYAKVAPKERLTFRHHRVRRGDTIGAIAQRYGMPASAIMRLNGVKSARSLRIGVDLIIPLPTHVAASHPDLPSTAGLDARRPRRARSAAVTGRRAAKQAERQVTHAVAGRKGQYVVRRGDTLWSIAQAHGVDVADLKRWNELGRRATRGLQVGRALFVTAPRRTQAASGRRKG